MEKIVTTPSIEIEEKIAMLLGALTEEDIITPTTKNEEKLIRVGTATEEIKYLFTLCMKLQDGHLAHEQICRSFEEDINRVSLQIYKLSRASTTIPDNLNERLLDSKNLLQKAEEERAYVRNLKRVANRRLLLKVLKTITRIKKMDWHSLQLSSNWGIFYDPTLIVGFTVIRCRHPEKEKNDE